MWISGIGIVISPRKFFLSVATILLIESLAYRNNFQHRAKMHNLETQSFIWNTVAVYDNLVIQIQ